MRVKYHKCEMDMRVKYYSTRVTWNFTREVHIYTLQEMWFTQTRDLNSISLCRASLRVHAPRFEVIIELYCMSELDDSLFEVLPEHLCANLFLKVLR